MVTIKEKIQDHFEHKKYLKIIRTVSNGIDKTNNGYIVDHNSKFVILQETDDFLLNGYVIVPIDAIKKIRFNKWDKYYAKMMALEGQCENVGITYNLEMSTWQSIFTTLKANNLNVIIECEDPEIDSFTIGPIIKTDSKHVFIQNFDPSGKLDSELTSIDFESITSITFADRYINVFSKYLRQPKSIKSKK